MTIPAECTTCLDVASAAQWERRWMKWSCCFPFSALEAPRLQFSDVHTLLQMGLCGLFLQHLGFFCFGALIILGACTACLSLCRFQVPLAEPVQSLGILALQ